MKYFGLHLSVILITLFSVIGINSGHSISNKEVVFKIETKDKYLLREPIWVDLYLTNNCKEEIRIKPLDLPWLVLQVFLVNSKGDTLKYSGMHLEYGKLPEGNIVKPNETYYHFINLLNSFGETTYSLEKGLGRFFLKEDTYTLQMYHVGIFSNKIKFTVEKPKNEEKRAHDLLNQAYYHDIRLENSKVIEILEQLISTYPKSTYADLAHYEIAGHYGLVGQPEKTHEYLRKLILSFPNSHFSLKALPGLLQQMKEDEKTKFLKEIIKKQPKTRASDWAQRYLEDLEDENNPKK